ncbi:MAG: YdiU family protein [Clostridiales bacterium]|nr:YdiU family protein [Clostridiales bacterium]
MWNFDNTYTRLPEKFFSYIEPFPVKSPELVILNSSLAKDLGLDEEYLKSDEGVEILAGNRIPEGALPIAQAYAGHQYGRFTMLGDGRAVLIGEQISPSGQRFDIQLKGSGKTPYSRGGDGRATLGPMLREYIISEAMYALGIATTRSLAVVKSGETVIRDRPLPGAVLTRVASSHIRFGTFEYVANFCDPLEVKILADYTIKRHYPNLELCDNKYLNLLKEVVKRYAKLISKWQLVSFIHGVMNTDNMTISGETIDFGPCAFMNQYDPSTVFSSIDRYGRYTYGNQPKIAEWNLARFAETLLPLISDNKKEAAQLAQEAVSKFSELFNSEWLNGMRSKLGIFNEEDLDEPLFNELLNIMGKYNADFTNTFRDLTLCRKEDNDMYTSQEFKLWYGKWQERLSRQKEDRQSSLEIMRKNNPSVIPRNHRVEAALEAAVEEGDLSVMKNLNDVLSDPYGYTELQEEYTDLPPLSDIPYRTFCGT